MAKKTDMRGLEKAVSDLWEQHGPVAILRALAKRAREEVAIAQGEENIRLADHWDNLAEDLLAVADDEELG